MLKKTPFIRLIILTNLILGLEVNESWLQKNQDLYDVVATLQYL